MKQIVGVIIMDMDLIEKQTRQAMEELLAELNYPEGSIFLLGCSSSEVCGNRIGKAPSKEIGETVVKVVSKMVEEKGLSLAVQCCEHINRAIVIEKEIAFKRNYEIVNVVPAEHAGGACAIAAYAHMKDPAVIEFVSAVAGIDIGDTFIGMHINHVCVPVRLSVKEIGMAHVTAAKSRSKLIGGERARHL